MQSRHDREDRITEIELLKMAQLIDDTDHYVIEDVSKRCSQFINIDSQQYISSYAHNYYNQPQIVKPEIKKQKATFSLSPIQRNKTRKTSIHQISEKKKLSVDQIHKYEPPINVSLLPKGILKNTYFSQQMIDISPNKAKKRVKFVKSKPHITYTNRDNERKIMTIHSSQGNIKIERATASSDQQICIPFHERRECHKSRFTLQ